MQPFNGRAALHSGLVTRHDHNASIYVGLGCFLSLCCGECGHDKLLAFSCKRREFRPSCRASRMSQTAAHLVDQVVPRVPVRQWELSLPISASGLHEAV